MADVFRTFIIPQDKVDLARAVSASFGPGYSGMFITPLSDDAKEPIEYFISSGFVNVEYANLWPLEYWEWQPDYENSSLGQGNWVLVASEGGNAAAFYNFALAAGVDCTLEDIEALLAASDITTQEPFTAMSRLSVQIVTDFAPIVSSPIPDQQATEDQAFQFTFDELSFTDVNAYFSQPNLIYEAALQNGSPLPEWLSFDPLTRSFFGTPLSEDVGSIDVALTATDTGGQNVSDVFTITVANTNDAPVVSFSYSFVFESGYADVSGTFSNVSLITGEIGGISGRVEYINPTYPIFGKSEEILGLVAVGGYGGPLGGANDNLVNVGGDFLSTNGVAFFTGDNQYLLYRNLWPDNGYNLNIQGGADANGTLTLLGFSGIADCTATEDTAFSFQFAANAFTDVDVGDTLTYTATLADDTALPGWLTFNAATRTFSGTPLNGDVGTLSVKVTATDGSGATATDTFDITVANTNDAPTLATAIADQSATEDAAFSFQFAADAFTDVDVGDTLTYTATLADDTALPGWLTFNAATRTFSGTPLNGDVGTLSVKVTATDGSGATATDTFSITVASVENLVLGTARADRLLGTEGRDRILGYAGDDTLSGLGGNDYLDGGSGRDRLVGGQGDDYYIVDNAGDVVVEAANSGNDTVSTILSRYSIANNVENLTYTGTGSFRGIGNSSPNVMTGGIAGDTLDGASGNDTMYGGNSSDTLIGGRGLDTLFGGEGRDFFVFNDPAELANSLALTDVIMDFELGIDRIDLSRVDASSIDRGNNTFVWSGSNASFGTTSAGEIRYSVEGGNTIIYGDTDRDTQSEFQIVLRGVYALTASDFVL